MVQVGLLK